MRVYTRLTFCQVHLKQLQIKNPDSRVNQASELQIVSAHIEIT